MSGYQGYNELVIGGVLMSPFVSYAAGAIAIVLTLRPVLRHLNFDRAFSNPPIATLSLFVLVLAALIVLF